MLILIVVVGLLVSTRAITGSSTRAAGTQPCDIYAAAGTPCVAAHSTVRALYSAYSGVLYQVRRSSDGTSFSIKP